MIALGGPKLKLDNGGAVPVGGYVSMIALGGPKLKLDDGKRLPGLPQFQ